LFRVLAFIWKAAPFVAFVLFVADGAAADPVICPQGPGKGAMVDSLDRCHDFVLFAPNDQPPDPRVARNLHLAKGTTARSIALIVGVARYRNSAFDVPEAAADVSDMITFLQKSQHFDEIIKLEDGRVALGSIRYYLRTYARQRANDYQGKVRFLFVYSGHGVRTPEFGENSQPAARRASAGLLMPNASGDDDYDNIYGMGELRALFNDLADNTYQFLALINACYGGDALNEAAVGHNQPDNPSSPGAFALTAGTDNAQVEAARDGKGSLFFETLLTGLETGDADLAAQQATIGQKNSDPGLAGIIRLGELDGYLHSRMDVFYGNGNADTSADQGNRFEWMGPVEPFDVAANGGFFFLQQLPSKDEPGSHGLYLADLQTSAVFAPTLIPDTAPAVASADDGLNGLRAQGGTVRGIDVSHINGAIPWLAVASQGIKFAYLKSTQGATIVDARFASNWDESSRAGIPRGAYHTFSYCDPVADQAALIIRTVPSAADSLPIAIDIEPSLNPRENSCRTELGVEGLNSRVMALAALLHAHFGQKPLVYALEPMANTLHVAGGDQIFSLWVPRIGLAKGPPPEPWSIWQYSNNVRLVGVQVPVDMDVLSIPNGPVGRQRPSALAKDHPRKLRP
jgi:lysozyme